MNLIIVVSDFAVCPLTVVEKRRCYENTFVTPPRLELGLSALKVQGFNQLSYGVRKPTLLN